MGILYSVENFEAAYPELQPLFELHYREISANLDIPLNVNVPAYIAMNKMGTLFLFVARDEETREMHGYAMYFVNKNMHYADSLQAVQDVIFIHPKHRGFGSEFIKMCDDHLRGVGVQVVYHHVKVKHDWGKVLERQGYNLVEKIYSKRLDKES